MTLPEVLLWRELRKAPIKFRRQHPAGPYVLDFYCPTAKLAIEVDGMVHDMGDRAASDLVREGWLGEHGIAVMRIPAAEVLKAASDVAASIVLRCEGG